MRKLLVCAVVILGLTACQPVWGPENWDPTMYCKTFPDDPTCLARASQGPQDTMVCHTADGEVFYTGQHEASQNGLICDHIGMGEG